MSHFDVAIVGAGPAGSWAAYRLARSGARVALLDASHPREKPCGGGITGRAFELIAGAVPAADLPVVSVRAASFVAAGRAAGVSLLQADAPSVALGVVGRQAFDGALLAAATRAGAEHRRVRVTDVERTASVWRVSSASERVTSNWVIGADGSTSLVRRRVALPFPRSELSVATGYFVRGVTGSDIAVDFDDTPTGYVWSFPRVDHLAVGACGQADAVTAQALLARTAAWIRQNVNGGRTLDRYSWPIPSLTEAALHAERPAGEGWMLVGDAAGLVDPITREGIYFALLSADHAATSLAGVAPTAQYCQRLRDTVYDELVRAAHLKARFFRPELLGLLVRALNRSAPVRAIMADLVAGRQTYAGLRRRLIGTLEWRLMFDLFRL
ncbi:MAG: geranylgeranyl reductase family protein [Vicinamibacterales bacterium]